MSALRMHLDIEYDDGATAAVVADQRDSIVFERTEQRSSLTAMAETPAVFMRSMAFNALKRTGVITDETRDAWEARCLSVRWNIAAIADPTKPVAPTASPRRSPTGRARATTK